MSAVEKLRVALKARQRLDRRLAELAYYFHRPGRVLFDHIPKCGGTTIMTFLARNYPHRMIFQSQYPFLLSSQKFLEWSDSRRMGCRLIMGHLTNVLIGKVHPETVITTIVREPIDRIVSLYYYGLQEKHAWAVVKARPSLTEFSLGKHDRSILNYLTQHFTGLSASEIEQAPAEAVDRAVEVVDATYDIVGFQDNLAGFATQVRGKARLWRPLGGLAVNRTIKRPALAELSQSDRDHIADRHAVDIELYSRLRTRWAESP